MVEVVEPTHGRNDINVESTYCSSLMLLSHSMDKHTCTYFCLHRIAVYSSNVRETNSPEHSHKLNEHYMHLHFAKA